MGKQNQDKSSNIDLLNKTALVFLFILIISIAAAGVFIYVNSFWDGQWWSFGNKDDFAKFGDFIGGLLNPIFAFFTVVLLVWSVNIQTSELKLSREELSKSSIALDKSQSAQNENIRLQKRENLRRQVQDDFEHHWTICQKHYDEKILSFRNKDVTLRILINSTDESLDKITSAFIDKIPELMANKNHTNPAIYTFYKIAHELDYMTNAVHELFKLLDTHIVACSIHSRVSEVLSECHDIKIINNDVLKLFTKRIEIPDHLHSEPILPTAPSNSTSPISQPIN